MRAPYITILNCIESRCIFKVGLFKQSLGALSLLPLPSPPSKSLSIRLSERVATPFIQHGSWRTSVVMETGILIFRQVVVTIVVAENDTPIQLQIERLNPAILAP